MHTEARSGPTATETTAPGAGFNPADALASIDRRLRPVDFVVMAVLLAGVGAGAVAYVAQLRNGLAVTGMSDIFSWGVYVVNFVFFIGVSMAGTLISAVLRLTNAQWRRPITRLAEAITVFSLLIAGPMIIIDMGRPDRFLYVLLHARVQSPIIWDVLSLTTYLAGSILYLYVPMLPDLAFLRDRPGTAGWRRRLYAVLALGWRGNMAQRRSLERGVAVLAIVIIPVAISIHTVTAWLFGMTLRPGWHSTIIGPDFVIGALYSGMAGVITAMAVFRQGCRLHAFITVEHFRRLGLLMLVFGLIYGYFMVNEYLGAGYIGERSENRHVWEIMRGRYAGPFWSMVVIGLVLPLSILLAPRLRQIGWIVAASVLVNIGMWIKRWIIIVPTLANPFMPPLEAKQLVYTPTWVEWCITLGAFSTFALLYLGFARLFPIVSLWEMAETAHAPAAPAVPALETAPAVSRSARAATAVPVILAALVLAADARAQTPPTPTPPPPPPAAAPPAAPPAP
ncbi:MAG: polysulfide reductase NrfD, partial [Phycisphaerales bacterium]|nr:polysulfide reductase NrfD [Phycisphaerales bacterium]